ncbi:MAG: hypothetical protein WCK16_03650 [Candidatus Moraniibacteriota bacterium]
MNDEELEKEEFCMYRYQGTPELEEVFIKNREDCLRHLRRGFFFLPLPQLDRRDKLRRKNMINNATETGKSMEVKSAPLSNAELILESGSENQLSKIFLTLSEPEQILFVAKLICLWKDRSRRDEARKVFCGEGMMGPSLFEKEHGFLHGLDVGTRLNEGYYDLIAVYSRFGVDYFMQINIKREGDLVINNEKLQMFWESMRSLVAPSYGRMIEYDGNDTSMLHYYTNP